MPCRYVGAVDLMRKNLCAEKGVDFCDERCTDGGYWDYLQHVD